MSYEIIKGYVWKANWLANKIAEVAKSKDNTNIELLSRLSLQYVETARIIRQYNTNRR